MTRSLRRFLLRRRPDSGFTLIELMMALLLMTIMMVASLYAIIQGLGLSRDTQERSVAANVVSGLLEHDRSVALTASGFNSIPITTESLPSQTIAGTTFALSQTAEWVSRGATVASCTSVSNSSLLLRVSIKSTWGFGKESLTDSTLLSPPSGTISAADGALAVSVTDSTGAPYSGATVTATPTTGTATTIVTSSDGCAFFAQLADSTTAGSYTVTVSASGGVNNLEVATDTEGPLTVTVTPQSVAVNYDQAGTVSYTLNSPYATPASQMPISVDAPSQKLSYNMYSYAGSGATGTLTPVYPGTYDVFAGGCTDADPNGVSGGNLFYPTANYPSTTYTNLNTYAVVPQGGSVSATVNLYPLDLTISPSGATSAQANSPASTPPNAVEGDSGTTYGGTCPASATVTSTPTYTLSPVVAGVSNTGVGLGFLTVNVSVSVPNGASTKTEKGSVNLWVKPDGVYEATGSTTNPTWVLQYSFTAAGAITGTPTSVTVPVS